MGHNDVVSNHAMSTGIPQVDGLSTDPGFLRHHTNRPTSQAGSGQVSPFVPLLIFF